MVLEGMTKSPTELLTVKRNREYCSRCGHEIMMKIPTFKRQSCLITICKCPECRRKLEPQSHEKPTG